MSRGWKLDSRQVAYLEANDRISESALKVRGPKADQRRSEALPTRISNSRGLTKIEHEGLTRGATGEADPTSVVRIANRTLQGSRGGEKATSQVDSEALGQMARGVSPVTGDALSLDPTSIRPEAEGRR